MSVSTEYSDSISNECLSSLEVIMITKMSTLLMKQNKKSINTFFKSTMILNSDNNMMHLYD